MKIGFIGLGIMGSGMAANLVKKGFDITVYNRTRSKEQKLISLGAKSANSLKEFARNCEILITMLSEPDAVQEFALGENGFLKFMNKCSVWIDCSTVNPSFTLKAAKKADEFDLRFLDAPVAGSKIPAETGNLIFYVGGDKNDFEYVKPILEAMGRLIIYMGGNGMGSAMKIVNNILLGSSMLAFSEALFLGEKLGISKEKILEILPGGPVTAPFISLKKEKLLNEEFGTEFPLQWMQKDLRLASETAGEKEITLDFLESSKDIFKKAMEAGLKEQDFSAIYKFIKQTKH